MLESPLSVASCSSAAKGYQAVGSQQQSPCSCLQHHSKRPRHCGAACAPPRISIDSPCGLSVDHSQMHLSLAAPRGSLQLGTLGVCSSGPLAPGCLGAPCGVLDAHPALQAPPSKRRCSSSSSRSSSPCRDEPSASPSTSGLQDIAARTSMQPGQSRVQRLLLADMGGSQPGEAWQLEMQQWLDKCAASMQERRQANLGSGSNGSKSCSGDSPAVAGGPLVPPPAFQLMGLL